MSIFTLAEFRILVILNKELRNPELTEVSVLLEEE
jgi:hypothetical protein